MSAPVANHQMHEAILARATALGLRVERIRAPFPYAILHDGRRRFPILYHYFGINATTPSLLARYKRMTNTLLRAEGLPIPAGARCLTLAEARAAYRRLGGSVVVKPLAGTKGHGVTLDIRTDAHLVKAVRRAQRSSKGVIVERFVLGENYRVLVLDGRVLARATSIPPSVVGDGRSTLAALIRAFEDARRAHLGVWASYRKLKRDAHFHETLAAQHLTLQGIPPRGKRCFLRRAADLSAGGLAVTVPRLPAQLERDAVRATRILGLRLAGVDVIMRTQGTRSTWMINEVNSSPMFALHLVPDVGAARDVVTPILRALTR